MLPLAAGASPDGGHDMQELAESFLYTPYWDAFNAVAIMAGLGSIVVMIFGIARSPKEKVMMWAGLVLLFLCVVFSMLFEEILPGWSALPEHRRIPYALSFVGFLVFLIMFVSAGRRFVRDVFIAFPDLLRRKGARQHTQYPDAATEGVPNVTLFKAMRPGLLWLGASIAVFLVSVVAYHGPEATLGWAGWGR